MNAKSQEKDALTETLRVQIVDAAKRHKASWVELGRYLIAVYKDKHYRTWGFMQFDAYCMKELGIKQTTASKLVKSYQFLEKEEPRLVSSQAAETVAPREFPGYEAVNLLRLAKENQKLTPHDYADLRESVMESGKEPKEIRAQMKKILDEREETDPKDAKRTRRNSLIKRLVTMLSGARREFESEHLLPDYLMKQMADLSVKLEAQIEE